MSVENLTVLIFLQQCRALIPDLIHPTEFLYAFQFLKLNIRLSNQDLLPTQLKKQHNCNGKKYFLMLDVLICKMFVLFVIFQASNLTSYHTGLLF